jgi:hypothetical protein
MSIGMLDRPTRSVVGGLVRPFVWVASARGWRKLVLIAAECLIAALFGVWLWRSTCLTGLPDVGDPFDVAAFHAIAVPPEADAYPVYARAIACYTPPKRTLEPNSRTFRHEVPHPDDPVIGRWLADNRKALDLFLEGSDRPEALMPSHETGRSPARETMAIRELGCLAMQDAARREARGDMEGAWRDYRAILRAARHLGRRGTHWERMSAGPLRAYALKPLPAWAADSRTHPALLRRAIDDVEALEALAPDDAFPLKVAYVHAMQELNQPNGPIHRERQVIDVFGVPFGGSLLHNAYRIQRSVTRETERSKRVVRLLVANWLAYLEMPPARRPKPALKSLIDPNRSPWRVDFFALPDGPETPPAARVLAPRDLARWYESTNDAQTMLPSAWALLSRSRYEERRDQYEALVTLAEALYRRDRGAAPPSPKALVGPYLKTLPDDGVDTLGDGTTPTLDDAP